MWKCIFVALFATVSCTSIAQSAPPSESPPTGAPPPVAIAPGSSASAARAVPTGYGTAVAPTCIATAAAARPGSAPKYLSKADHLRIAAEHLKAAGRDEEAGRVRLMETEERSRSESACIQVDIRMIEISLTKLGQLSTVRYGGPKDMSALDFFTKLSSESQVPGNAGCIASPNSKLAALIDAIRKDDCGKVLAEPSLMTTSGRPASVHVGGEVGYRVKDDQGKDCVEFLEYGLARTYLRLFCLAIAFSWMPRLR